MGFSPLRAIGPWPASFLCRNLEQPLPLAPLSVQQLGSLLWVVFTWIILRFRMWPCSANLCEVLYQKRFSLEEWGNSQTLGHDKQIPYLHRSLRRAVSIHPNLIRMVAHWLQSSRRRSKSMLSSVTYHIDSEDAQQILDIGYLLDGPSIGHLLLICGVGCDVK